MKNTKLFLAGLAITGFVMALPQSAHAQYGGQYGQYGNGGNVPENKIQIDKKVAIPDTVLNKGGAQASIYIDNLEVNDKRYIPGAKINYRINVKNTTNQTLKNISVIDFIPSYMEPIVGPGIYDKNTRQITYVISELKPGQINTQYVEAQIYPQDKLPADKGIVEVVNKAQAKAQNAFDEDTSKAFIEKQNVGLSEMPKTGPELGLAFLTLQGVGLALGLKLRKANKS